MEDLLSAAIDTFKHNWFLGVIALLFFLWIFINYNTFFESDKDNLAYKRSIEWIKQNTFAKRYLYLLNYILSYISKLISDEKEFTNPKPNKNTPKWMQKLFGFNPFTTASYRAMLILAFIYPILSLYITWWLSGYNKIGEFDFAPHIDSIYQRGLILTGVIIINIIIIYIINNFRGIKRFLLLMILQSIIFIIFNPEYPILYSLILFLPFIIFFLLNYVSAFVVYYAYSKDIIVTHTKIIHFVLSLTIALAIAFEIAFAKVGYATFIFILALVFIGAYVRSFAIAVIIIFAVPFVNIDTVSNTIKFAISFILLGIIFSIFNILEKKFNKFNIFWFLYIGLVIVLSFMLILFFQNNQILIFILLLSLLPILNAILDWISLGFTRGLLTSIISGHHKTKDALLWAILDLFLAVVFLVLISVGMIALVGLSNHLAGTTIYNLNEIFTNFKNGDIKQNFWIYFMMFSTLLPTLLHFILAILSLIMWLPDSWRKELIKNIQNDQHKHIFAFLYLTFTPIIAIAVVLFICWEGYKLLSYLFTQTDIGSFLLNFAQNTYNLFL